ncbi:hypothetical protein CTAM01_01026, partial [Colletotrichum tamarilloi]
PLAPARHESLRKSGFPPRFTLGPWKTRPHGETCLHVLLRKITHCNDAFFLLVFLGKNTTPRTQLPWRIRCSQGHKETMVKADESNTVAAPRLRDAFPETTKLSFLFCLRLTFLLSLSPFTGATDSEDRGR